MVEFKELYPKPKAEEDEETRLVDLRGDENPTEEDLDKRYVTVREASEILQVVPMTVYRMLKRGELRMTRIGPRKIMVFKPDLDLMTAPTYYKDES